MKQTGKNQQAAGALIALLSGGWLVGCTTLAIFPAQVIRAIDVVLKRE